VEKKKKRKAGLLVRTRTIVKIIQAQSHLPNKDSNAMAFQSYREAQDFDQDMADSSSSINSKRGQLTIHQPTQQKKQKLSFKPIMPSTLIKTSNWDSKHWNLLPKTMKFHPKKSSH
jgi:hypothetical protein